MNALQRDLKRLTQSMQAQGVPDKWRMAFHLMPPVGWLNDPNGLCFHQGAYHVFYQYAPFNPDGGLKLWGHYTSPDFIHWKELPTALYPDQPYDCHGVYSGSAISEGDKLYVYYTGNVKLCGDETYDYIKSGREHNTVLAVSADSGKTFPEKYLLMRNGDYPEGLTCHVRDPKVWKQDNVYYMVQGARTLEDVGEVLVFSSEDKRNWRCINTLKSAEPFGYMWECPDLFTVGGQTFLSVSPQGVEREKTRFQNIYQSGYFTLRGDFTGEYSLENFREYDYGFDFYAPQTFEADGRRILIAWMGMADAQAEYTNPTAALGWQHVLTVPRELTCRDGALCQQPVAELENLRGRCSSQLCEDHLTMEGYRIFDMEILPQGSVRLLVRGCALIEWDNGMLSLRFQDGGSGRGVRRARVEKLDKLRILGDESSLEIFANDGQAVMSSRYYPEQNKSLRFDGAGRVTVWKMEPMEVLYDGR